MCVESARLKGNALFVGSLRKGLKSKRIRGIHLMWRLLLSMKMKAKVDFFRFFFFFTFLYLKSLSWEDCVIVVRKLEVIAIIAELLLSEKNNYFDFLIY